jgi:hypothetical protein
VVRFRNAPTGESRPLTQGTQTKGIRRRAQAGKEIESTLPAY